MGKEDLNKTVFLHDKAEIAAYLRKDAPLNIYSLGDLDDFFWEHTSWLALKSAGEIKSLALLYTGSSVPTLLVLCGAGGRARALELIAASPHLLPDRFYAHLSPGLVGGLTKTCALESHGLHHKMALINKKRAMAADAAHRHIAQSTPHLVKVNNHDRFGRRNGFAVRGFSNLWER